MQAAVAEWRLTNGMEYLCLSCRGGLRCMDVRALDAAWHYSHLLMQRDTIPASIIISHSANTIRCHHKSRRNNRSTADPPNTVRHRLLLPLPFLH